MSRRVELVTAAIAAAIGLVVAALAVALGGAGWFILLLVLGSVGVALGAYQHAREATKGWLATLWVSSFVLLVCNVLSILSVGFLLLPATLLAAVASVIGSRRTHSDNVAAR